MFSFIRNCFNYIGGKDKLLKQIHDNIDFSNADNSTFVDVFSGSGVVGVNMSKFFKYTHLNDACWQVIRTIEYFRDSAIDDILGDIEYWISTYELSKTNKQGYLDARLWYNTFSKEEDTFNPALFYTLVMHSFSYNITLNSKKEFNVPAGAGRSYFNNSIREKLIKYQEAISRSLPTTTSQNFKDIINVLLVSNSDLTDYFFYLDPPYFSSNNDAPYGRIYGLKWTEDNEKTLYNLLDKISAKNGKFLLSNVVENKGNTNNILKEWMGKYNVVEVDSDYSNCSYQRKNNGKTKEILVRNY